ncbi:MAG TPA: glycerophosphodiester phosphodiesterase [Nocardioidaceae bacterium]|nr:glycerophosphodiester phosphodiesterase [Nocardioidaceae bacterium]
MTRPRTGYPYLDVVCDQPQAVLAFAHRGGAYHPEIEGLENTMVAFQHAVELGYTYLETDVHATRDGGLFALHDAALDRVTQHRGAIAELSSAEVSQALIGGRELIPTMTSLLEEFPEVRFNIDIKSDAAVAPLAETVRATKAHDRICVGSFSQRRIDAFRRVVGGKVATAGGPLEVGLCRVLPAARLVDVLVRRGAGALQIPRRRKGVKILTRGLIRRAHALGMHVHVWTIDDPAEMHDLLDMGVDGLMTDRTDLLRDVLVERGQWMGVPE